MNCQDKGVSPLEQFIHTFSAAGSHCLLPGIGCFELSSNKGVLRELTIPGSPELQAQRRHRLSLGCLAIAEMEVGHCPVDVRQIQSILQKGLRLEFGRPDLVEQLLIGLYCA